MNSKLVVVQGSSKSNGNTRKISDYIVSRTGSDFIDLKEQEIGYFDYEFANQGDDFLPLIKRIIENYDGIIFATPVYWYSMSATMKTFFDRISDLLIVEKDLGRSLRGMKMGMVSCSGDQNVPEVFAMPFSESAKYLGMDYIGSAHSWVVDDKIPGTALENLKKFVEKIVTSSLPSSSASS